MTDIPKATKENDNFRKVLFTTNRSQLVVMSVPAGEDIGQKTHEGIDQILTFVEGEGGVVRVPSGMGRDVLQRVCFALCTFGAVE